MSDDPTPEASNKDTLLARLDEALESRVPLTPEQQEDVHSLREELARLWDAGRRDESRRCFERAVHIIEEGPPPGK